MAGQRFSVKEKNDVHRRAAMLVFESGLDVRTVAGLHSRLRREFGDDLYDAVVADVEALAKTDPFPIDEFNNPYPDNAA